jgi:hypothetical protein
MPVEPARGMVTGLEGLAVPLGIIGAVVADLAA